MEDDRVVWPMESITFTKTGLLALVLPALDAAIDSLEVSMVQSDLMRSAR